MNIAIFIEAYTPYTNGVITHVSMLHDSYVKLGHNVLIVTADPSYKKHTVVGDVLYCPALQIQRLYGYGLAMPSSAERDNVLDDFAPDIVHIHQEFGVSLYGLRYARRNKIPIVYTLHTMYDDYFSYVVKAKLAENFVKDVFCIYLKYFVARADAVLSPSTKAVSFLQNNDITKKDVIIVPNAIDTALFDTARFTGEDISAKKAALGISETDFTGVFVGRLGYEKSIDYLIRFWADRLGERESFKLIVIGDGPERENLENMAAANGLGSRIRFIGKVEHDDVPLYLAAADYYISASLSEMMSISMLEAMASGLPAILRYDEANASQIEEGVNGRSFRSEDELESLLIRIAEDGNERKTLRQGARAAMLKRNSDAIAEEMIKIYGDCIESYVPTADDDADDDFPAI